MTNRLLNYPYLFAQGRKYSGIAQLVDFFAELDRSLEVRESLQVCLVPSFFDWALATKA